MGPNFFSHGFEFFLGGISWVHILSRGYFVGPNFLVVFCGFKFFSCGFEFFPPGYFVGPSSISCLFGGSKMFLVIFFGFKFSSRGYFVSLEFFPVSIFWVQNFSWWVFRGAKFFSCAYFVGASRIY